MTPLLDSAPHAGDQRCSSAGDRALVLHGTSALVPVEQRLERLRRDREEHTHKQVWTKDPHDGPYRKARGEG